MVKSQETHFMDGEQREKAEKLARDILILSRNMLMVNLRFLDEALARFEYVRADGVALQTDGHYLRYDPFYVLQRYGRERTVPVRDHLHIVLHCVYRHMFVNPDVDHAAWDLACDIAVENVITELEIPAVEAARAQGQKKVLDGLRQKMKMITAEKIYRHYRNEGISQDEIAALREHFRADDHAMWYMAGKGAEEGGGVRPGSDPQGLSESWRNIAERIQQDLETFSKTQGDRAGDLVQNLKAVNRERHDYGSFLRKFAVRGEVMRISPDEFDYIYYTYGLRHYKKMPLIEPLEYREAKRIREFVIAIDTSGSVAGELVQAFVQKTYNILKNTESFFSRINLHIIQCDAEIQEDVKITSQEEFDAYLRNMKLHGFGGTDFRPVFRLVDNMVRNHEFTNLKGLVYFTDGYGTFPERKPGYDAAFIFLDDGYEDPETPPWAIKLVLQMDEAEEIFGLSD